MSEYRGLRIISTVSALIAFGPITLSAQTTQGLITGRVTDALDGMPIAATVTCRAEADAGLAQAQTGRDGYFALPLLSPGRYRIRVEADRYQPQELQQLDLPVAGFLELPFRLRALADVWEQGLYRSLLPQGSRAVLTWYGPDIDTTRLTLLLAPRFGSGGLEPAVSEVVSGRLLRDLPLAGRDAYALLVAVPGVSADTGSARGLGFSATGQRPSASNFLLDSTENNNYVTTGPLTNVSPESIQEYRVSLGNFSAEYGRTSGFLANAVTQAGTNRWHGIVYQHLRNDALNANGFQQNRLGLRRPPFKEWQPGFAAGGPLRKDKTYVSGAFELLRTRQRGDPEELILPTTAFRLYTAPGSIARGLLERYPAPFAESRSAPTSAVTISPPASLNRLFSVLRLDRVFRGGKDRVTARAMYAHTGRADFIWTPYPDFVSPLAQNTLSFSIAATSQFRPGVTAEARIGVSDDDLHWDRPHAEVATLASYDGTVLPGSPAFYGYRNRTRNVEGSANLLWMRGAHFLKTGGGVLFRRMSGRLTAGADGRFLFDGFVLFGADWPDYYQVSVRRGSAPPAVPDFFRRYGNQQVFGYVQDSWRVSRRLVVNLGARYENFGVPAQAGGTSDMLVQLGDGPTLPDRIAAARFVSANTALYDRDNNNVAARAGVSFRADDRTQFRGSLGIFFDRPFDNLWQNIRSNGIQLATIPMPGYPTRYLEPPEAVLARYGSQAFMEEFPEPVLYQPGMRDAYAQNYFAGLRRSLGENMSVEANALGSLGRKLITTDRINRPFSVAATAANPAGRFNPALGTIAYRGSQGSSSFHGLGLVFRRRSAGLEFQASYTWSHAIDNQSEPLAGDFFDLDFTRSNYSRDPAGMAAFARQFDSRADRGSSGFDQRHNLVVFSIWELPAMLTGTRVARLVRNWRMAEMAAVRSGFPYSVLAAAEADDESIYSNRADMIRTDAGLRRAIDGGYRLLDPEAFRAPLRGLGNSGRNAFCGPGMISLDWSVSRSFSLTEAARLTFRVDAFNVLNHANLGNPAANLSSPDFGVAQYGRTGRDAGFPALVPLNETARRLQLLLRIEF